MRFVRGHAFLRGGRCRRSAWAAVKAGAADVRVVDHRPVDVGVVNHGGVHVGDRRVIREMSAAPFSATKSHSAVSESIVDAAVKAHVRAPNIRREIRKGRPRIPSIPESTASQRAAARPTRPAPRNIRPPRYNPNIPASRGILPSGTPAAHIPAAPAVRHALKCLLKFEPQPAMARPEPLPPIKEQARVRE